MRILVADDDGTSRLMLKAMVSKLGHQCLVAEDGSSAWERLSSGGIDVLLTDWLMPGLNGPDLCRRVRNELGDGYIYIVLITGLGFPDQVLEGMNAGADDYLIKASLNSFAVETRLIAAERVTALHRQLVDFRSQLEQANSKLLEQSRTDALTGLGNRRRMEVDLELTLARALRAHRTFGVVLFDIDYFKLYNDHYGHVAGDETLRRVALRMDDAVRAGESTYRYGGEEFLLIVPDCQFDELTAAAERIGAAVAEMAISHGVRPAGPAVVTLSGGVAYWTPGSHLSIEQLLQNADHALFQAKGGGRNCIVTFDRPQPRAAKRVATGGSRARPGLRR